MKGLRSVIGMALLLAATCTSHPFRPNQYGSLEHPAKQLHKSHHQQVENTHENVRKRRSYTPWTTEYSYQPYNSITIWQPPVYQLNRPYYIPIWGVPGRLPLYFPPQPLPIIPPTKEPFKGPTYLPPSPPETTTEPSTDPTTMQVGNRFGEDDEKPVWDAVDTSTKSPGRDVVPTRKPLRPGRVSTIPPLFHGNRNSSQNSTSSSNRPLGPVTAVPPSSSQNTVRTEGQDASPILQSARPIGPTACVWAIISCCSADGQISYDCFDQRGCPGAFWDNSPCDNEFARAAIASAVNYYNS